MSFFDSLIDLGKSALNFVTGDSIGGQLARTALTGYALNKVSSSIAKENNIQTGAAAKKVDPGVRLQVDPEPNYSVPVVYGSAVLGGVFTDAALDNNNTTMWYCLTICEQTGKLNLGTGADSVISFGDIYWDGNKLKFDTDGQSVLGYYDKSGNFSDQLAGNVFVYCYTGGSAYPTVPKGYINPVTINAQTIFPNWGPNHNMEDLVFAIVQVNYDSERDIKGIGDMRFQVINSMSNPGDCLYDYMTNTRYGAGIVPAEINV